MALVINEVQEFDRNRNRLPFCMGKKDCMCLEEMSGFDFNTQEYKTDAKNYIERFLIFCNRHRNKESFFQMSTPFLINSKVVKWNILFLKESHKRFYNELGKIRNICIDFPGKNIYLRQYLNYIRNYVQFMDYYLEISIDPNSAMSITYLRNILECHFELLLIFEQFANLIKYGFSFAVQSKYGNINFYTLYFE